MCPYGHLAPKPLLDMCPYGHIAPKPLLAMCPYKKIFFSKIRYKNTKTIKNCYFIYYLG